MELLATYDLRRQVLMGYLFAFESSRKVRAASHLYRTTERFNGRAAKSTCKHLVKFDCAIRPIFCNTALA